MYILKKLNRETTAKTKEEANKFLSEGWKIVMEPEEKKAETEPKEEKAEADNESVEENKAKVETEPKEEKARAAKKTAEKAV